MGEGVDRAVLEIAHQCGGSEGCIIPAASCRVEMQEVPISSKLIAFSPDATSALILPKLQGSFRCLIKDLKSSENSGRDNSATWATNKTARSPRTCPYRISCGGPWPPCATPRPPRPSGSVNAIISTAQLALPTTCARPHGSKQSPQRHRHRPAPYAGCSFPIAPCAMLVIKRDSQGGYVLQLCRYLYFQVLKRMGRRASRSSYHETKGKGRQTGSALEMS
jgi:hypothetical protein